MIRHIGRPEYLSNFTKEDGSQNPFISETLSKSVAEQNEIKAKKTAEYLTAELQTKAKQTEMELQLKADQSKAADEKQKFYIQIGTAVFMFFLLIVSLSRRK